MGVELGQLLPAGAQVSQVIPLTGAVHSDAVEVMAQLSIGEAAQQLHHPGAGAAPFQHSVGDAGVVNAEAHNFSAESFSVFLCRVDEGHELFVLDVAIFDHVPGELAPVDGAVEDVAPAFVAAGVGLHRDDRHVLVLPVDPRGGWLSRQQTQPPPDVQQFAGRKGECLGVTLQRSPQVLVEAVDVRSGAPKDAGGE